MTNRGKFIVLEGGEGAGKSTHARKIVQLLRENNRLCQHVFAPGATDAGAHLRNLLLRTKMCPLSELLTFLADLAEVTTKVIQPALERGEHVVCDRYVYSTIAYQIYGREIENPRIREMTDIISEICEPNLILWLDIDPEVGLLRKEGTHTDRFESDGLDFHKRVYRGYQALWSLHPIFSRVDASGTVSEVFAQIKTMLSILDL